MARPGCISDRGCYGRSGLEGRQKRRWYFGLIVGFSITMIVVVTLATTLHRKSNTVVGPSQWLNLTGFPPIFTGLSTIASPSTSRLILVVCSHLHNGAAICQRKQQAAVGPNPPNQPNFLLEIQWDTQQCDKCNVLERY